MKKLHCAVVLALMLLCGCVHRAQGVRIAEESFSLEDAAALVEELEEPVAALIPKEETSWGELLDYGRQSMLFSPEFSQSLLWEWLGLEREAVEEIPEEQMIQLDTELIYPTLFHQDVSVIEATVRRSVHQEGYGGLEQEELLVTESYTGTEPLLKGFERVYTFEKINGVWTLSSFSGVSVYSFDKGITIPLQAQQ